MKLVSVALALAVLAGCKPAGPVPDDPSYSADVQPLFNVSCVSCHSGQSPTGYYDLTNRAGALGPGSDTIANVIPGSPESSRLQQRLETGEMPPSGPLDTTKVATVRNWIARGAKDN